MSKHKDFILSPISHILNEVVSANSGIGNGIETYPLGEYIMQSVFLKMTGSQEQKMKCICWELATDDYEYRYLFTKSALVECSSYNDKKEVYQDLIEQIKKFTTYNVATDLDKAGILMTTISDIKEAFLNTNLSTWSQKGFDDFERIMGVYQPNHVATDHKTLFAETANVYSLKKIYENYLCKHRNRCAHNTQSYQENLPTLKTMFDADYKFHNYFVWFSVLVLIDKIFIEMYHKYLHVVAENHFQ